MRILVTDAEQRAALAIVRSLGRAGHRVEVCATSRSSLAGASRHCRGSYSVADPTHSPADFAKGVSQLALRLESDLVIPVSDTSITSLLAYAADLPGMAIPEASRSGYERLSNKREVLETAAQLGIAVPDQVTLHSHSSAEEPTPLESIGFPLVLKPSRSSVETASGMRKLGVSIAASADAARRTLERLPAEAYPVLAQRRIVGQGRGVFMLLWEGRVYAAMGHRRIREKPPWGGVSVYRESVPLAPAIADQAFRLLDHFGWSGVAMVEFKEDAVTGKPYLMEVNARFWGSLQLAIDAGVDFPRMLADLAVGRPVQPVTAYRTGVRSRWLWGEVDHLLACLRAGPEQRRALHELPTRVAAIRALVPPWRPGDRFEVLRVNDPVPFFRESLDWFRSMRL